MDADENVNSSYLFFKGSKNEHFSKIIQCKYTFRLTFKPDVCLIKTTHSVCLYFYRGGTGEDLNAGAAWMLSLGLR